MPTTETASINLSQHFLIAMPGLQDSGFERSVIYICEHNEHGAFGLCINKPLEMPLEDLVGQGRLPLKRADLIGQRICWGGPLHPDHGFLLHKKQLIEQQEQEQEQKADTSYTSTLQTADDLQMTTSKDVLDALSEGYGPAQVFAALGYSAWSSGQLEDEIRNNSWLTVAADHALIFEVPFDERYDRAMLLLGVQPWALAFQAGTA